MSRAIAGFVCAICLILATAGSSGQPAARPITLEWDANPEPAVIGYIVHVRSTTGIADDHYNVGNTTSFVFSAALPGQAYFFTVTAYTADGLESPHSAEVSTIANVASIGATAPGAGSSPQAIVRFESIGTLSGITALQDGRLLLIENARSIRLLTPEGAVSQLALADGDEGRAFTEVVVNTRFPATRHVFVGAIARLDAETMEFNVVRYREVQGTLGEGAALLAPLRFAGAHVPRFTVDEAGRIYVAMPAAASSRSDPYASHILRFNADGTVPKENRAASPVFARGFTQPANLGWDGPRLLAIGASERWSHTAARLNLDGPVGSSPQDPEPVSIAASTRLVAAAFAVGGTETSRGMRAFIDDSGRLSCVATSPDLATPAFEELALPAGRIPVAVAAGFDNRLHVIARSAAGTYSLVEFRLSPPSRCQVDLP